MADPAPKKTTDAPKAPEAPPTQTAKAPEPATVDTPKAPEPAPTTGPGSAPHVAKVAKRAAEKKRIEAKLAAEDAAAKKRGCFVAEGRSVSTKIGLRRPGDKITAEMLGGGQAALEHLIEGEYVIDRR